MAYLEDRVGSQFKQLANGENHVVYGWDGIPDHHRKPVDGVYLDRLVPFCIVLHPERCRWWQLGMFFSTLEWRETLIWAVKADSSYPQPGNPNSSTLDGYGAMMEVAYVAHYVS